MDEDNTEFVIGFFKDPADSRKDRLHYEGLPYGETLHILMGDYDPICNCKLTRSLEFYELKRGHVDFQEDVFELCEDGYLETTLICENCLRIFKRICEKHDIAVLED